ncbi:MAG: transposase [Bacillota bacterium]
MRVIRGYKFKLKTTPELQRAFATMAGHARFVWNKALRLNLDRLERKAPIMWYSDLCGLLRLWKQSEEYGFLAEAHSQALQQKLKDLDRAFADAFDKNQPLKKLPRFKKKGRDDSFRFPQDVKIDNRRVCLPKIGWVGFFKSQEVPGTIRQATVTREADGWYVSFQVEIELPDPVSHTESMIGLDRGVDVFAATSEGELVTPVNALKNALDKLARLQRKLARQKKFSKNWRKTRNRIAKLHRKIARTRQDFLHKLSSKISKSHAVVALEDLPVGNMTRSAKSTLENPGRNVRAKSGLNRAILDQGWSMFERMLEYKLGERGGQVVPVPAPGSSHTCSACGHADPESRVSRNLFQCVKCGHTEHADINAAKVILQRAKVKLAA